MTQEDKELLLKDLSARLPYDPFVKIGNNPHPFRISQRIKWIFSYGKIEDIFDNVKPYLRPMSSMTEEEKTEYRNIAPGVEWNYGIHFPTTNKIDWLNAHHFDFRNLIERGLAIDCTNLNIY